MPKAPTAADALVGGPTPKPAAPRGLDFLLSPEGQALAAKLFVLSRGQTNLLNVPQPSYRPSEEERAKAFRVGADLEPGASELNAQELAKIAASGNEQVAKLQGDAKVAAAREAAMARGQIEADRQRQKSQEAIVKGHREMIRWQYDDVQTALANAQRQYLQDGDPRWEPIIRDYLRQSEELLAAAQSTVGGAHTVAPLMGPPVSGPNGQPPAWGGTGGSRPPGIGVPKQPPGGRKGNPPPKPYDRAAAQRDYKELEGYWSLWSPTYRTVEKYDSEGSKVTVQVAGPSKGSRMAKAERDARMRTAHAAWTRLRASGHDAGIEPGSSKPAPAGRKGKIANDQLEKQLGF
jgi:hypothetical protein